MERPDPESFMGDVNYVTKEQGDATIGNEHKIIRSQLELSLINSIN